MLRAFIVASGLLATLFTVTPARALSTVAVDQADEFACEDESVFGTFVVVDAARGIFGLLGTRYKFVGSPDLDLRYLVGREVKIDIDEDCSIQDIHILDGDTETIT
jgi:hypothetical protein